ncbi:type III-A CRISPR-associated protein Csm2 [Desulfoluna butyratoxydans]|uniref:CRISPR system Cms protein Csm2 n=1 Tax=Desulfoluna butyratoxydans TaxID=231438 RepID=A0A4U8YHW7_9BACT|nr:type III-A CRISPR-associated protein Csm2 [Desulfoluna butyratoxydans]VFQ43171.1 crispr-associated protein csm2 type iii-a [Desulfoluna butyratoxydans]
MNFWKDKEKGHIEPLLFSTHAQEKALLFSNEGTVEKRNGKRELMLNKASQIRRFYDELSRLEDEVRSSNDRWHVVEPQVHMLVAKAAYAEGRKLVSHGFKTFIQDGATAVTSPQELKIFRQHFESIIGFFRMMHQ